MQHDSHSTGGGRTLGRRLFGMRVRQESASGRVDHLERRLIAVGLLGAIGLLAAPAAASAQQVSGTQTFVGIQASPDGPGRVIAAGPITAIGTDEVVSDGEDIYHFPAGDVTIDHQVISSHESFDPATCAFRLSETGAIQIVHGTKAYAGATGTGTYQVQIFSRGCGDKPSAFVFFLRTQGPIALGS